MNKITITWDKEKHIMVDTMGVDASDAEMLAVFLEAYLIEAQGILKVHNCGNPECCIPILQRELIASINSTVNLHNVSHHHE